MAVSLSYRNETIFIIPKMIDFDMECFVSHSNLCAFVCAECF
jgi:hypothetical protein